MKGTLTALLLVGLILLPVSPSAAHSQLIETRPATGSVLDEPPRSVTFIFNETLIQANNTIAIVDASGEVVHTEMVPPGDNEVSIRWPGSLGEGLWQVSYRVVSADGHPVQGAIEFTIGSSQSPPEQQPSSIQVIPDDAATSPPALASQSGQAESAWHFPIVLGGTFVTILLVAIGFIIGRKRQRR